MRERVALGENGYGVKVRVVVANVVEVGVRFPSDVWQWVITVAKILSLIVNRLDASQRVKPSEVLVVSCDNQLHG
jgi:hypothetical protein